MSDEGNTTAEYERVEALRLILEREQCRPVSYAEAAEIGDSLMRFFEVLAEGEGGNIEQPAQIELVGGR